MIDKQFWQREDDKSGDYYLSLVDPEGWYEAGVRWDGCINFTRYFNTPLPDRTPKDDEVCEPDCIHICDLDGLIERLQALRVEAMAYFKEKGTDYEFWYALGGSHEHN